MIVWLAHDLTVVGRVPTQAVVRVMACTPGFKVRGPAARWLR